MKSLIDTLILAIGLAPAKYTTTQTITLDLADAGSNDILLQVGAITDGTFTLAIYDGALANASDKVATTNYQATSNNSTAWTVGALSANTIYEIGYIGVKRYVTLVITVTGSPATGAGLALLLAKGNSRKQP